MPHESIAVGTAVASRPPHRSVREGLPRNDSCLESGVKPLLAASRTPCKPLDLRLDRLCVRGNAACRALLLTGSLSSLDSVGGFAPPLFTDVEGTTDPSDFLLSFMSAVPSVTFADRVLAFEVSTHARVSDSAATERVLPLRHAPCCPRLPALRRHTRRVISELNGWPVCTPVVATPTTLPSSAYNSGPVLLARSSL